MQGLGIRNEPREGEGIVSGAPRPRGHGKIPASGGMLSDGADPAIDESISDNCRSIVDPLLLSKLIRMVEVECVEEFVDCVSERLRPGDHDRTDFAKALRATHPVLQGRR